MSANPLADAEFTNSFEGLGMALGLPGQSDQTCADSYVFLDGPVARKGQAPPAPHQALDSQELDFESQF